jgi:hypothetical protein
VKRPEDVSLSREEGEALLTRLETNTLTAEDRQVLGKVLTFYFWLLFALREAKLSLKRVKALVFGEKPKPPKPPASGGSPSGGSDGGSEPSPSASHEVQSPSAASGVWTWDVISLAAGRGDATGGERIVVGGAL